MHGVSLHVQKRTSFSYAQSLAGWHFLHAHGLAQVIVQVAKQCNVTLHPAALAELHSRNQSRPLSPASILALLIAQQSEMRRNLATRRL